MGVFDSIVSKFKDMRQRSKNVDEFKTALLAAAADGSLSNAETKALQGQYAELGLTLADLAKIRVQVYAKALDAARADGRVTADEEAELLKIQEFLKIPDSEIRESKATLARQRLLSEIQEGNLPSTSVSNVVLQKSETAYWSEPAALMESRVVARRYEGGSQGVSLRIMKGVSYRVGQSRGHLVTDKEVLPVSRGDLIITNKRVIFRGDAKSFNYKFDKILDVNMFSDGVRLTPDTGTPRNLQFASSSNSEVFAAVLSAAINQYGS